MKLQLYNSLSKKKEEFGSIKDGEVGIYSCGPTVYWNQHIGHMYAYVVWDVLVRTLKYQGYGVHWVVNITDVGHMTSDEDTGEDKMEKGAKREGLSVWEIAEKYIKQFEQSMEFLNIQVPEKLTRATEHIEDQIELSKKIEENGYTYKTKMGLVFDTEKFADYAKFANLKLDKQKKREDVEVDPGKKTPWDFFLWVRDPNHAMHWPSPWGEGYPGWHIECTAMSTKYLGRKFDIHTGGVEHIPVHHTNEIAQGYGAYGDKTANYWLHNAWLTTKGGEKMSKSKGNFLTVQDLVQKGYDPLALRYLIISSHYRKGLNFSFSALAASQTALNKLRNYVASFKSQSRNELSKEKLEKIDSFRNDFNSAISDDLNTPKALAVLWEMVKSNIPNEDKYDLLMSFDEVLGLGLNQVSGIKHQVPSEIQELAKKREMLREKGKYEEADKVRKDIEEKGYTLKDSSGGTVVEESGE